MKARAPARMPAARWDSPVLSHGMCRDMPGVARVSRTPPRNRRPSRTRCAARQESESARTACRPIRGPTMARPPERHRARDERLGIHAPARQLPREMFVILLERRREGRICFLNERFADQNPVLHKALYHTVGVTRKSYLAFDLGAESGRAVLARLEAGLVRIDEIHRFPNTPLAEAGTLRWDVHALWREMRHALSLVGDTALSGIAVDSWGVDYALLGAAGRAAREPLSLSRRAQRGRHGRCAGHRAPGRYLRRHRRAVHADQHDLPALRREPADAAPCSTPPNASS